MKKAFRLTAISIIVLLLVGAPVYAASTTKTFATNYTLVNLGDDLATVSAEYIAPDGTEWGDSIFKEFSIPVGANQIVRQYDDTGLPAGQGSVRISSSQPLGALVQEIVRTGTPTSGAYTGIETPSATWFVPMAAKGASSASGIANTQIVIQNLGTVAVDFTVELYAFGATSPTYTKDYTNLASGASVLFDLADDTNVPAGWWGSVVVSTTAGDLGVISHLFFGADSLMAFNGFQEEQVFESWFIPLLYVRLGNSLTTSLAIQNLSGVEIPVDDLTLSCTKNPSAPGADTITLHNHTAVPANGSYTFNTLTDTTRFPDAGWYGSCKVESATGKGTVTLVMYRYTSNAEQAAYGAVPGNLADTNVSVPLVAKRLSNGYANVITVQNLGTADATATLTYTPSGGGDAIIRTGVVIPAGESIIRNFRLTGTELPEITDGWVGSLSIEADQPIAAYVANTYLSPTGDQFMAYLGFNY